MHHLEWCANVVQTFWPVTTYSSPLSTARVFSEARSEPDSGSEKPWHHISSALRMGARKRSFWASVPWAMTVGPPIVSPSTLASWGARERANSSNRIACSICVAPAPPYSVGQVRPAQPRSLSLRCQSRRNWNEASSPSGSLPGWFASIHARSVSRNSSSEGESVRSTARKLTRRQNLRCGRRGGLRRGRAYLLRTRRDRDAAEDQHETADRRGGDRLVAEDGAVEERDARRQVGDQRGARRPDPVDQLVVDDEGDRGADRAEHDDRGDRARGRRVARGRGDPDRQRDEPRDRDADPR